MDVQIAQTLYQAIDAGLKSTISTGVTNLMSVIGVIFGICWITHLTVKSIYWLFQGLDVAFQDLLLTIGKAGIIIYFAFNVGWYVSTVVPVVNELPNGVSQLLSSSGKQTNQVDSVISSYISALADMCEAINFSIWDEAAAMFLGVLAIFFYVIGGVPYLLIVVGTLITLKTAISVILVFGPVFILFSLFDQTRQWFWGWLSVICGFMLTMILFSIIVTLQVNFINSVIIKDGKIETDLLSCFSILLYFGAFTLLATELPNYAASIMGGAPSGGVGGIGGILGGTGLGSAGRMSRAAGKGISKGIRSIKNRNKIT